jgi:putative transposase
MPLGLNRYQQEGDDHFITFSCHNRKPYLNTPTSKDIFLDSLERTRTKYQFEVLGYVVMPEHVHLLINEPPNKPLSKALQSIKISASRRLTERPFWQPRYYDFNVFTHAPQPGHTRPRRKAGRLALVLLSPLSPQRTIFSDSRHLQ